MKYLMMYSGNWNEEIDVDGYIIINKNYLNYIKNFLNKFNYTISVDIGFKEEIEYENGVELLQEISFDEITDSEAVIIEKYFGLSNDFGSNLLISITKSSEINGDEIFKNTYDI